MALLFAAAFALGTTASAYEGVGASLGKVKDDLLVIQVFPGSPAARGGLRPADRIVAIDGKPVGALDSTAAAAAMRGASGTALSLTVRRRGAAQDFKLSITRGAVELPDNLKRLLTQEQRRALETRKEPPPSAASPSTARGPTVFALFSEAFLLEPGQRFDVALYVSNPGWRIVDDWQARVRFDPDTLEAVAYRREDRERARALDVGVGEGVVQIRPKGTSAGLLPEGVLLTLAFRVKGKAGLAYLQFEKGEKATFALSQGNDALGAAHDWTDGTLDLQFQIGESDRGGRPVAPAIDPWIDLEVVEPAGQPDIRRALLTLRNPDAVPVTRIRLELHYDPTKARALDTDRGNWVRKGVNLADGPYHEEFPFDFHYANSIDGSRGTIIYDMGAAQRPIVGEGVFGHVDFRGSEDRLPSVVLLGAATVTVSLESAPGRGGRVGPVDASVPVDPGWGVLRFD